LPSLMLYISTSLTYTYVALLLETHYAVSMLPVLLVVYGLGGLVGSQMGGRLADRLGPVRPIFIGLTLLTLTEIAVPFSLASTVATCVVLFLVTMSNWSCFAPMQARLMHLEPANAGVVIALINAAVYIGNAIGAMVGATLMHFMPVTDLPFASALVSFIGILLLMRKLPD
jgi:predicted MFS family arabinose efflux permease